MKNPVVQLNQENPTIEEMRRALIAAGWEKYKNHDTAWKCPNGPIYRGPFLAYQVMQAMCRALPLFLICLCGCASYSKTGAWTPDGMNITESYDHTSHGVATYVGFTWTFKK